MKRATLVRGIASALALLLAFAALEIGSLLVERLSATVLDEPIRKRSDVLSEQTQMVESLLDMQGSGHVLLDPELGWLYRPGYESDRDTISARGTRGSRVYADSAPVLRVAAFGDSFTYGDEVAPRDAWTSVLERSHPVLEVMNFGVGGYGADQALMRYRRERFSLNARVVLLGFVSDDIRRAVSRYRRFISTSEPPLVKPRFLLSGDSSLAYLPPPGDGLSIYDELLRDPMSVRQLGVNDHWYNAPLYEHALYDKLAVFRVTSALWRRLSERYLRSERLFSSTEIRPGTEAFRIQVAIFRDFAKEVHESGAVPLVVFFPDRTSLNSMLAGGVPLYRSLLDSTRAAGVPVLDTSDQILREARSGGVDALFMPRGHYTARGNMMVAQGVAEALRRQLSPAPDR